MATTSTNLSLTLPVIADTVKVVDDFNVNMNILDGRFSATYMAIQAKNAVTITGGTITGITDLVVSDGGTGVSTLTDGGVLLGSGTGAITAMAVLTDGQMIVGNGTTDPVAESGATLRTSIGVAIGSDVQAWDTQLDDIAALAVTNGNFIVGDGSNWVAESGSTARTSIGLGNVENTALSTWAGTTNITTLGTIATGTWSATTIALNKGGTGQTAKTAAFDALSPITTLGDIIYGNATVDNVRLAGNTTSTKKFLTQTGNGSISGAPTWATIIDGDIPNSITVDLATLATTLTITDNESTNENNAILFTSGGAGSGNLNIEADGGDLFYNPSTGTLRAPFFSVSRASESTALNAAWLQITSTVNTGDLTGLRTVMTSSAVDGGDAANGVNVRGVYGQAICTASKHAGLLQGGLFTASAAAGTVYNVHVLCGHYSSGGATTIGGDLYVGYLRAQTRESGRSLATGNDCLLALENEAVSGTGQIMDSAIRIFDTNMGVDGFTYGIDMSSADIATADIRLQNGEIIKNTTDGTIDFGAADLTTTGDLKGTSLTLDISLSTTDGGTGVNTGAMINFTSMLNAALYVGRDTDNTINFATDNHIIFKTNGATCMEVDSTGELDMNANAIGFTQQTATGDGTTTIDWKLGNKFYFTFGTNNDTFTFTAPTNPCNLILVLKQYSTGGKTATWPETVMWVDGTAPTLSTGNNEIDIVSFYYDGTNYFGIGNTDFAVPA